MSDLEKLFEKLGYEKKAYTDFVNSCNFENCDALAFSKIKDLLSLGYTEEESIKMIRKSPLLCVVPQESIVGQVENIVHSLGLNDEERIGVTQKFPQVFIMRPEYIRQKIDVLKELGYTDIKQMVTASPRLLAVTPDAIGETIDLMRKLGYLDGEIIKMTESNPTLYSSPSSTVADAVEFYDSVGLHDMTVMDAEKLNQNVRLSYARYKYYQENGKTIDMSNYEELFIAPDAFQQQYGMSTEQLIEKYNYDKDVKVKQFGVPAGQDS